MNTHTKKWNAWNEIVHMYQQNFQPDVIAHVKEVVLLLRLGGVKRCSLYQSVLAGSVYISKISKANKVSTHDMRSSTAGIRRSTCWNKHVLLAFHARCQCNTGRLQPDYTVAFLFFFQVVTQPLQCCFICFMNVSGNEMKFKKSLAESKPWSRACVMVPDN